jgi:hypothetical protein
MSCTIQFEKDADRHIVYLAHGGKNLFQLEQFANWLQGYSLGAITKISASQVKLLDGNTRDGDYGAVSLYATILMRAEADNTMCGVILPAPDASVFDTHQEVTPDFGIACAAQYSILAKTTLLFVKGALCGNSARF